MIDDKTTVESKETTEQDETKSESLATTETTKEVSVATETTAKEEGESSESLAEESTAKESDGKDIKSELDAILSEDEEVPVKKDGVQKRIDKLTAEKKALQEKLERLESEKGEKSETETNYTDEQLKRALRKAMDESDPDLVYEIMDYRVKQAKKELRDEYQSEQKKQLETANTIKKEWAQICDNYDYLSSQEERELYPGARKELNIKDNMSLLYQVALSLYNSEEDDVRDYYRRPGGQKLAVADALQLILRKKRDKLGTGKEKNLEKKLAKEKRKSSLGSGESLKEESPAKKFLTEKESLDDYLAERRKFKAERTGF